MPKYSTYNRLSLIQFQCEERKHQAHVKKVTEMQHHRGSDAVSPPRFLHLHQGFLAKQDARRQEIDKENQAKSQRLINIMRTKSVPPPPPFHSVHATRRNLPVPSLQDNNAYRTRIAKVRGEYDVREWSKEYQYHQVNLDRLKGGKVFTPMGIGVHRRQSIKTNSLVNSNIGTPTSSVMNLSKRTHPNN